MKTYAAGTPVGANQVPLYGSPPPFKAIGRYLSENGTASSVITLSHNTTAIEIGTGAGAAVMRWVTSSDTEASVVAIAGATANFDHFIPPNSVKRFVVPIEIQYTGAPGSMVGERVGNGLFARVAYKTQGIASVAVSEYGNSNSY